MNATTHTAASVQNVRSYLTGLQETICAALETLEGEGEGAGP